MESEGLAGDLLIALVRGIVGGGRIAHQSAKLSHEFRPLSCHDSSRISFGASPFVLADCSLIICLHWRPVFQTYAKSSTACPGCFPFFFVKITIGLTGRPLGLCPPLPLALSRAGKFIGRMPKSLQCFVRKVFCCRFSWRDIWFKNTTTYTISDMLCCENVANRLGHVVVVVGVISPLHTLWRAPEQLGRLSFIHSSHMASDTGVIQTYFELNCLGFA